jgi:replicative DNA helicase
MENEAEYALIGCLLQDSNRLNDINLSSDDFQNAHLGRILDAVSDLIGAGIQVDTITVSDSLQSDTGNNWIPLISNCVKYAFTPSQFMQYAKIIRRESHKRKTLAIIDQLRQNINNDGSTENAIRSLMAIDATDKNHECGMSEAIMDQFDEIERASKAKGELIGLNIGINKLNEFLGGFHKGDLIIVAGRPAMGKTALAINMMLSAKVIVGFISSEQGRAQIAGRALAISSGASVHRMRSGVLEEKDWDMMLVALPDLKKQNIRIYDAPSPSLQDIQRQARKWKMDYDIQGIYIDYLQRLRGDPKIPKHERIGDIAQGLKEIARELNIPVIALAQLSREVEKRTDKRPIMSDLAESGVIEREADQILTIYRDEVYNSKTNDVGIAEINILKNRHGKIGCARVSWIAECMRFIELDYQSYQQRGMYVKN